MALGNIAKSSMKMIDLITAVVLACSIGLAFSLVAEFWQLIYFSIGLAAGIFLLVLDNFFLVKWYQLPYVFSRSLLFLLVYMALAIYVFTTGDSWLGGGFILGLGLMRAVELIRVVSRPAATSNMGRVLVTGQKPLTKHEAVILTGILVTLLVVFMLVSWLRLSNAA